MEAGKSARWSEEHITGAEGSLVVGPLVSIHYFDMLVLQQGVKVYNYAPVSL